MLPKSILCRFSTYVILLVVRKYTIVYVPLEKKPSRPLSMFVGLSVCCSIFPLVCSTVHPPVYLSICIIISVAGINDSHTSLNEHNSNVCFNQTADFEVTWPSSPQKMLFYLKNTLNKINVQFNGQK